jgi:O-antigen/teichoic acid export membrane protein
MGVIKNQSIKTSILFGIGVLLGFVLRLYVFPSYLKPNEIGLLTVLLDMSNIFGALIPLGGQTIFIRYLSKFKSDNVKSDSLRTLVLQLTILGLILFTITFFLLKDPLIQFYQDQAALLSKYFLVILPMVYFRVLYLITTAYSKGSKRTVFPLFVKEIFVRLSTILLIILYAFLALNTEILVSLYLGIYFLSGTLVFISIRKFGGWSFSKSSANVGQDLRKEILVFGSFSILTSVGTIMIRSIDSIMLSSLKDLDSAGIYSIAFFIGVFVEIPRRAISQISRPVIAEAFHEGKISVIRDIYQKSALNQLLLGSFIYILIVGSLDSLFAVIPNGEIYSVASNVVLIIGAAKLFDMSMGGNSEIIGNSPFLPLQFR